MFSVPSRVFCQLLLLPDDSDICRWQRLCCKHEILKRFNVSNFQESDFQGERFIGYLGTIRRKHPIATNESNFDSKTLFWQIRSNFLGVTYSAGCSVLRMIEAVVAPDFYTIINKYLNKFAFGNADMSDLIALITEVIFLNFWTFTTFFRISTTTPFAEIWHTTSFCAIFGLNLIILLWLLTPTAVLNNGPSYLHWTTNGIFPCSFGINNLENSKSIGYGKVNQVFGQFIRF